MRKLLYNTFLYLIAPLLLASYYNLWLLINFSFSSVQHLLKYLTLVTLLLSIVANNQQQVWQQKENDDDKRTNVKVNVIDQRGLNLNRILKLLWINGINCYT